jgi:phosphoglycerate dehydrogenase-like enzyme
MVRASESLGDTAAPRLDRGSVLITAPGFVDEGEAGELLRNSGLTVDHAGAHGSRRPHEVAMLAQDAVGAIVSSDPFDEAVFAASQNLRVIARLGVGTDSIDLQAATRAGVIVTITPGLNDETCADHALALLLAAIRRVIEHDASVRSGEWNRGGTLTPWNLHDKSVGVIGYGRIGRHVVARLRGFGTQIKVFDPAAGPEAELACPTLEELLAWADVVMLHAPLTPETNGLIGASELARMKRGAILVNTSRGALLDETALLAALTEGRLRAAALDVFQAEPPGNPALLQLPNVVLSPHIGGLSGEAIDAMMRKCVQQVLDVLDGRIPDGVVNGDVLSSVGHLEGEERLAGETQRDA